jgi:hypothetical protein
MYYDHEEHEGLEEFTLFSFIIFRVIKSLDWAIYWDFLCDFSP